MGLWTPIINSVFELLGSRVWQWKEIEQGVQVQVIVPYNESHQLIKDIIELETAAPEFVNPLLFERIKLYLQSASVRPMEVSNQQSPDKDYYLYLNEAVVTLSYSSFTNRDKDKDDNDRLKESFETYEPGADHQILDHNLFYWGDKPTNVTLKQKEAPVRQLIGGTYTVYWYNQEEVPDEYFNLIGSVNNAIHRVRLLNKFIDLEQMLYFPAGYSKSLFWKPAGTNTIERGFNYVCKWLVKLAEDTDDQPSWNKYYRQETGTDGTDGTTSAVGPIYDKILRKVDDSVYNNFPVKDHTPLLP